LTKLTKKLILLNKKEGETPLEALSLFRNKHKEYKDLPMTYAGRLDPMASGLLVILSGEECKNKEKYLKLDKEYEFEILFGFATDSYDILGKTLNQDLNVYSKQELEKKIKKNLKYYKGKFMQKYPVYSSKTVSGKALFEYGRAGIDVDIPEREVNVKSLKFLKIRKINLKRLLVEIEKRINKVDKKNDFRQKEILKIWKNSITKKSCDRTSALIASFNVKCTSGTYVRGIANSMGERLGVPALAYTIKRTKIGKYS